MRTRVVVLAQASEDLKALEARNRTLAHVARAYIGRLALEPDAGAPVQRGWLAGIGARRVRFSVHDQPGAVFGHSRRGVRRGDQSLDEGPAWRIVYSDDQAPGSDVRLVVVAAVGRGHTPAGQADAYELAELRLKDTRKSRKENQ